MWKTSVRKSKSRVVGRTHPLVDRFFRISEIGQYLPECVAMDSIKNFYYIEKCCIKWLILFMRLVLELLCYENPVNSDSVWPKATIYLKQRELIQQNFDKNFTFNDNEWDAIGVATGVATNWSVTFFDDNSGISPFIW